MCFLSGAGVVSFPAHGKDLPSRSGFHSYPSPEALKHRSGREGTGFSVPGSESGPPALPHPQAHHFCSSSQLTSSKNKELDNDLHLAQ